MSLDIRGKNQIVIYLCETSINDRITALACLIHAFAMSVLLEMFLTFLGPWGVWRWTVASFIFYFSWISETCLSVERTIIIVAWTSVYFPRWNNVLHKSCLMLMVVAFIYLHTFYWEYNLIIKHSHGVDCSFIIFMKWNYNYLIKQTLPKSLASECMEHVPTFSSMLQTGFQTGFENINRHCTHDKKKWMCYMELTVFLVVALACEVAACFLFTNTLQEALAKCSSLQHAFSMSSSSLSLGSLLVSHFSLCQDSWSGKGPVIWSQQTVL